MKNTPTLFSFAVAVGCSILVSASLVKADVNPMVVSTIADLRTVNVSSLTNDTVALVIDYYQPTVTVYGGPARGRGGGFFRWRTLSSLSGSPTPADDGGRYISPNTNAASAGIWERLLQGETPNVKMWGAKGDASSNDYLAIQKAVNACNFGWAMELLFPAGQYEVTNTIFFPGNLHIRGEASVNGSIVSMPVGIQKDIFCSINASNYLNDPSYQSHVDYDHGLLIENLAIEYEGTETTWNTNNACLVVALPGEASIVRNISTGAGGYGIRCLGVGAPGLKVQNVSTMMHAIAGVSIEGGGGGPVSLMGVSGDQNAALNARCPNASLIRIDHCSPTLTVSDFKAEGNFGGGLIMYSYGDSALYYGPASSLGSLTVGGGTYIAGAQTQGPLDFIVLKGDYGRTASLLISPVKLYGGPFRYLIRDEVSGRNVQAEVLQASGVFQTTARLPIAYESSSTSGVGRSRLVIGQTAFYSLTTTNVGWYRILASLPSTTSYIGAKLTIWTLNYQYTEFHAEVNALASDAWINVVHSTKGGASWYPAPVTKARAGYSSTNSFVDVYVDSIPDNYFKGDNKIVFGLDINGAEGLDTGIVQLLTPTQPLANPSLPSGTTCVTNSLVR